MTITAVRPSASSDSPIDAPAERRLPQFAVSRRRVIQVQWIVGVIGLLATIFGTYVAADRPAVYWATVQVRFVAPTSTANPNSLQISSASLIMLAGAVGQMVNDNQGPRTSAPTVNITGLGIRNGWLVTLPNSGGQWMSVFANPYLQVQAVGPSVAAVGATMQRLVNDIAGDLVTLETRQGVSANNYVQAQMSPLTGPQFFYQQGSPIRAVAASLALGIGLSVGALTLIPVLGRRRITRRRVAHA